MKNTNFTKIAVLVLSLALLMGAVVAVSASAADEPEIFAQNVIYGDKISIVYAVDTTLEAANAGEVKVKYYWEDAPDALYDAVLLDTTDTKNLCEGKPTFATTGVAPKELGKVAYATAYTGDAPAADAEWKSYSVAEYLYDRLYKDGYVNYDEGDGVDYNRKNAYEALLDLGANLQLVLGYETNELVTDYTYAYTTNADVTINGKRAAFDVASVNAVYNGSLAHVGWTITDLKGNVTEADKDAAIAVNGVIAISPKIDVHECADTNNDHYCDKCSEKLTNCGEGAVVDGLCDVCKKMTFEYDITTDVSFYTFSNKDNANPVQQTTITATSSAANYYGVVASLATDPAASANQVLKIVINDGVNNTQTAGFNTYGPYLKFNATDKVVGGDIHVIEYDFYVERLNKATQRNFMELWAYDTEGNGARLQNGGADGSTNGHTKSIVTVTGNEVVQNCFQVGVGSTQADNANYALLDSHTWYRLRFVYDVSAGTINSCVSFDGGNTWYLAAKEQTTTSLTTGGVDTSKIDKMALRWTTFGHGEILYIDNINYYVTDSITLPTVVGNDSVEHP